MGYQRIFPWGKSSDINLKRSQIVKKHVQTEHSATHTDLVDVMFGGAAAVTVSGRRRRHLLATWLLSVCLLETAATEITAKSPGASLSDLWRPRQQSALLRERLQQSDVGAAQRWHSKTEIKEEQWLDKAKTKKNFSVFLTSHKTPKEADYEEDREKYPEYTHKHELFS